MRGRNLRKHLAIKSTSRFIFGPLQRVRPAGVRPRNGILAIVVVVVGLGLVVGPLRSEFIGEL